MSEERFVGVSEFEDDFRIYDRKRKDFLTGDEVMDLLNDYEEKVKYLGKMIAIFKYDMKVKGVY